MPKRFYITTAIDYPNNPPHVGHAFEKIGADVQARFRRMLGYETFFLIGNDENTVKVAKRAAELAEHPKAYVDRMAELFKDTWRKLHISNDDFIQTSEPRHHAGCKRFIQKVYEAGYIYKQNYRALYCEGCEAFKTARELVDGKCQNHPNINLQEIEEENYFFALSGFRDRLLRLYEERPEFIQPEGRRNEIVSLVESGLEDISITRQKLDWGIPVPFDESQTIYVWFDALLNYITGIGYGSAEDTFRKWWPAQMHVIGKDITRFHCALWPAMLMAAELPVPERVQVHGFVLLKGAKMSKSLGNVVDPMELSDRFGPDAFRYFLMKECPFTADGDFSYERFVSVYNADLANNLGNLYSRMLTMCLRYFEGKLERVNEAVPDRVFAEVNLQELAGELQTLMETCQYNQALALIWQRVLDSANRYVDRMKPFELAKTDKEGCRRVLINLAEALRVAAILISPFVPETAAKVYGSFNFPKPLHAVSYAEAFVPMRDIAELHVTAELQDGMVPPLFPRIRAESPD